MRAELGPPAHEMAGGMNTGQVLVTIAGTRAVGPQNLTMFPLFWWMTGRGYRSPWANFSRGPSTSITRR